MARSRSTSERVALAALVLAAFAGGCRLFVDLDGLNDEGAPGGQDAALDQTQPPADGGLDAPPSDAPIDAPVDANVPKTDGGCPWGGGPKPVRVDGGGTLTFCIDSTEVSREHYGLFLATAPSTAAQPTQCAWNTSFTPSSGFPYDGTTKDLPVVGVDWCDAVAFCAWAGKRMCGGIGPVTSIFDVENPLKSERTYACSAGGTRAFPYGNAYSAVACNGLDKATGGLLPIGSQSTCEGGFPGIFDLSGNAHEWTGICGAPDGGPQTAVCAVSASAWGHPQQDMGCVDYVEEAPRDYSDDETSFRCCSD